MGGGSGLTAAVGALVLLDTHTWIWWVVSPRFLSERAAAAIDESEGLGISPISCWEIGMLVAKRKLGLDRDVTAWVKRALSRPGITIVPLDPRIGLDAALLDQRTFPSDPADRMIYATARSIGATLITKDQRLRDFDPRGTLW